MNEGDRIFYVDALDRVFEAIILEKRETKEKPEYRVAGNPEWIPHSELMYEL